MHEEYIAFQGTLRLLILAFAGVAGVLMACVTGYNLESLKHESACQGPSLVAENAR